MLQFAEEIFYWRIIRTISLIYKLMINKITVAIGNIDIFVHYLSS